MNAWCGNVWNSYDWMVSEFNIEKDMLSVDDVGGYLGVGRATVYRWCKEGRLPCLKVGKSWRIRRAAFEDFIGRAERSSTLAGQLRSFLAVPDTVIGIAQTPEMLRRLDAAFFQVGEARGGFLVKFYGGETVSTSSLRTEFGKNGLNVRRLEAEGRFRFIAEHDSLNGRGDTLKQMMEEEVARGRTIWASFDWAREVDVETAMSQQEALTRLVDERQLVVKTAVLEQVLDAWSPATQRRTQTRYSGTMWLSEAGLALSRLTPTPPA